MYGHFAIISLDDSIVSLPTWGHASRYGYFMDTKTENRRSLLGHIGMSAGDSKPVIREQTLTVEVAAGRHLGLAEVCHSSRGLSAAQGGRFAA